MVEGANAVPLDPVSAIADAVGDVFTFLDGLSLGRSDPTHQGYMSPWSTALVAQQQEIDQSSIWITAGVVIFVVAAIVSAYVLIKR